MYIFPVYEYHLGYSNKFNTKPVHGYAHPQIGNGRLRAHAQPVCGNDRRVAVQWILGVDRKVYGVKYGGRSIVS